LELHENAHKAKVPSGILRREPRSLARSFDASNAPSTNGDRLFQRGADRGELELGAEPVHDRNDRQRDAGGDQAVFDGGCAGLVCKKPAIFYGGEAGPS